MNLSIELVIWIPFTLAGFVAALLLLPLSWKALLSTYARHETRDVIDEAIHLFRGAILNAFSAGLFFAVGPMALFQVPPPPHDLPAPSLPIAAFLTWSLIGATILLDIRIALDYMRTRHLLLRSKSRIAGDL